MTKLQLKIYWVLLHEYLQREQVEFPPDTVAELKDETKRMADHYKDCVSFEHMPTVKAIKAQAVRYSVDGCDPTMWSMIGNDSFTSRHGLVSKRMI